MKPQRRGTFILQKNFTINKAWGWAFLIFIYNLGTQTQAANHVMLWRRVSCIRTTTEYNTESFKFQKEVQLKQYID